MKPGNDLVRESLAERLIATSGRPSGFDYLRLGLAVSIVIVHSGVNTYGDIAEGVGSLERSKTVLTFIGLRVIRIYPALAVEVALSAFLIGAAVTAFPLGQPIFETRYF